MEPASTITIASLASLIGLALLRALLKNPKFSFVIKSKMFNMSAQVGQEKEVSLTDSEKRVIEHHRKSHHSDVSQPS